MAGETELPVAAEADIVVARQVARETARDLGFGMVDQARIATAVSELTRNIVRYATDGKGRVVIRTLTGSAGGQGIEIVVADDGPGMADVDQVMQDGFTSGSGLGMGLPGTKRLMDEMEIESALGSGTTVTIRRWRR